MNSTLKDVEKSLSLAWTAIEDLREESKSLRDSKSSDQKVVHDQNAQRTHLMKVLTDQKDENDKRRLSLKLKETPEKLVALKNYTKRENLWFMNIPECRNESCRDITYDIIEKELTLCPDHISFHDIHSASKLRNINGEVRYPHPIIARPVFREEKSAMLATKNCLKSSVRFKEACITQDYAREIQKERKILAKAMFAAKQAGRDAKLVNRKLFTNCDAHDVMNIPVQCRVDSIHKVR